MSLLYVIEFPLETYAFPVMHVVPSDEIFDSKWTHDGKVIQIDMNVNAYTDKEQCLCCIREHCTFIMQVQLHEMKLMAARLERNLASTVFEHPLKTTLLNFGTAVKDTIKDLMNEVEPQ